VRAGGTVVWALTWQDVKAALTAASQGSTVPATVPLANPVRHTAVQGAKQAHGAAHPAFDALSRGGFDQLMLYLAHPEPTAWRHLAMTTALAAGSAGTTLPVTSAAVAVDYAARHLAITPADHDTGIAALTWSTLNDQQGATIVERNGSSLPTTVLSLDTGAPPDKSRWAAWLQLGNLLQHLGAHAVITTTRTYASLETTYPEPMAAEEPDELYSLLADIFDPGAVPLARAAIDAGWRDLVPGYSAGDADDTPIEVAWPALGVGILPTGGRRPAGLNDWDLRPVDAWTTQELLDALSEGAR
jgi:hypothetical protein